MTHVAALTFLAPASFSSNSIRWASTRGAQRVHLGVELLGGLCRLRDLRVALGEVARVVGMGLGERVFALAAARARVVGPGRCYRLLLCRLLLRDIVALRRLLTCALRLHACTIVLTVHVGPPFKFVQA